MSSSSHLCAVCLQKAKYRCSRCQETWYCSVEHQRQDWKSHKASVCLSEDPRVLQLIEAISCDNKAVVKKLASIPAVLNGRVSSYNPTGQPRSLRKKWSPLHECTRVANLTVLKLLLKQKPNLEVEDETGATPLFVAVSVKAHKVIRTLLNAGADPDATTMEGWSALVIAVRNSDIETVETLLQNDVDVMGSRDPLGRNALDVAEKVAAGRGMAFGLGKTTWETCENAQDIVDMLVGHLDDW
ncbi:hypothetical protein FisN_20Hh087 [Fistulifera solaris]|uniref:MYND-type domain-containing protein n=1 Tax=Fistulifera solaris TaxID=1519565 RepID=A0A1Z5KCR4_FISSO|nr:hypothetical protein FisN_20Hh087 [Fistulifera solaris]|eukprot:GAX23881.1 hypothetical protein FisN_20Hh087 [Fistulifera solaris]